MIISFFVILPRGPLNGNRRSLSAQDLANGEDIDHRSEEGEGLLAAEDSSKVTIDVAKDASAWKHFKANLKRSRSLIFPL